jgi:hypothetical protein
VPGLLGQAHQNQQGRLREPTKTIQLSIVFGFSHHEYRAA